MVSHEWELTDFGKECKKVWEEIMLPKRTTIYDYLLWLIDNRHNPKLSIEVSALSIRLHGNLLAFDATAIMNYKDSL